MNKNIFITVFSSIISILASLFVYNLIKASKEKSEFERTLKIAGKPGESNVEVSDELDNSDMVAEGSQFGVQYYDKHKDLNK